MRQASRSWFAIIALCGLQTAFSATQLKGTSLSDYLESLAAEGQPLIFSSDLVGNDQVLLEEPDSEDPVGGLPRLLKPYGLKVVDGPSGSQTYLEREPATRIPAAAEEAVRLTNRLPGTAGGGISSRNHVRGGEVNEVLFLFDGLRLYEPYHLKDFQSVASIVNASAISGVDLYTGGCPVRYGDRMSGVMNLHLREPARPTETELALSFFNTSALSLGRVGEGQRGDWLVAARRGSPDYQDVLLHVGWEFGARAVLTANLLASHDKLNFVDDDVGETANAKYDNNVFWLKWLADWSDALQSETIVSLSEISDRRYGSLDLPGIVSGTVDERRDFKAYEVQQDWMFAPSSGWMISAGFRARHQDAEYRHDLTKTVLAPYDQVLDNEPSVTRSFVLAPEGGQYAAYTKLRWQPIEKLVVDVGVRWDQQTYTTSSDDRQYSPRASVLFRASDKTEVRLGFGQFYQA